MQRSTGKELTVRKSELSELLSQAFEHHEACVAARSSVGSAQQVALWHGWQAGIRLNQMKALVPSGDWEDWVELHFCKPKKLTIRTAQIYMRIDNDNAALRDKAETKRVSPTESDFKLLTKLKFDTIRKHAIGFVPDKSQPKHKGNVKFPKLVSFLNIVNEYNRLKQRHKEGLQAVDFNEIKEESLDLYEFLQWIHGDAEENPWA